MGAIKSDASSRFEAVAQHFHRDTGYVAPGKDIPSAIAGGGYVGRRDEAWRKWDCDIPITDRSQP
jgi:hypothetical protein